MAPKFKSGDIILHSTLKSFVYKVISVSPQEFEGTYKVTRLGPNKAGTNYFRIDLIDKHFITGEAIRLLYGK